MAPRARRIAVLMLVAGWLLALLLHGPSSVRAQPAPTPGASVPAQPAPAIERTELRGVWLTANDMPTLRDRERMQATVAQLAALNFNTLYAVAWNGGHAYYPSPVSEGRGLQSFSYRGLQGQDVLAELSEAAHRHGLLLIPWFEFGFMTPPDGELARRHPDWLTRKQDGGRTSISAAGEVAWLNPFRPEVQQLITDLVLEVVGNYDADGIQFDDHMSLPREFGYDPFTMALYAKETGKPPPANPADAAWMKWRTERITAFIGRLSQAVKARRPGAIVSVSPNYYDFALKLQLQDWLAWVRRGLVDELLIQIYRPDLESFVPQLDRPEVQESQRRIPTAIGIMSGQRTRPAPMALIQGQVQAARERQLGVAFFYLESLWALSGEPRESRLAALAQLFSLPARRQRPPSGPGPGSPAPGRPAPPLAPPPLPPPPGP
ncbi:glycoside hydrolase family 10 protein [Vulcanococcus limneticus]|uniref:glycoside hydrolase family 10 protein n=1 Tax=Vulcanococcus limneticus TaxID=2170428 RepID=UPI001E526B73|nr:glycoside hydrolase family 10 protein [Vulcanococcus limneticus]